MIRQTSAKYHPKNKEKIQKNLVKDIKILLKKEKTKSENIIVNAMRISQKMKAKIKAR